MATYPIGLLTVLALAASGAAGAADDGAKSVDEHCGSCHTPKVRPLEKMHLTREQWAAGIEKMAGMGVEIPGKVLPVILDYLARTQGPEGTDAAKR
jgi:hypothetical protein